MLPWLQLIRWKNLLITALTQILVYYFLFYKNLSGSSIHFLDVFFFIICTLIIAASGNIINDVIDIKADFVNRPFEECYILNYIGIFSAVKFYYILIATGGIIALYLSIKYEFYFSFLIYPVSIYLFWLYSKYLQCMGYLGNLFVSFFIASVVLIMPYFFMRELNELRDFQPDLFQIILRKIILLGGFAFMANLFREIVKDMEDYEGDLRVGCETGCVKFGIKTSLNVSRLILVLLLLSACIILFLLHKDWFMPVYVAIVILPIFVMMYFIFRKEINFSILSMISKIYMLLGMLYFVLS